RVASAPSRIGPFSADEPTATPLRRADRIGVKHHSHLAAEKIEQYCHPLALGHFLIKAEAGREDAVQYADPVADSERRRQAELYECGCVFALLQPFNHTHWRRRGVRT